MVQTSSRHLAKSGLYSRNKHFIHIYITLGFILCIQFFQFRRSQKDIIAYIKEGSVEVHVLAVNASHGLRDEARAQSGATSDGNAPATLKASRDQKPIVANRIDAVRTQSNVSAHESYIELRKIMDQCDGEHTEPVNYWLYYFDCNDKRLVPALGMDYMLKQGKSISDSGPKVRFTGTDIGFAGQIVDFLIAELFFMHPTPQYEGRYLEIGGYYGLQFSNSLFFEQYLGWDGWLFEPTTCFDEMARNRPKASSFKQGLCKEPVESMNFGGFDKCSADLAPCKPLTQMDGWEGGFDVASIDVEGAEMNVLKAIDFTKVKVKVLVINWRPDNKDEREEYLKQFGYEKVTRFHWEGWGNGDEIYYRPDLISVHSFDSSAAKEAAFDAPPASASPRTPTEAPSYEPTYVPTDSNENSEERVFAWDKKVNDVHGNPVKMCHVIENVCRRTESKYWFYFQEEEDNGFELKHKISRPNQPILSYQRGSSKTRINMDAMSLHQNTTWIKQQQCIMSPVENHVVLNGDHIHMMGEFVQRIIIPLHHILEDYALYSKNHSSDIKEIQFYLNFHFNENQKLLPSHHLYMNGLPYGQDPLLWSEILQPTYAESSPPCQCYSRLAFCGFQGTETNHQMEINGSSLDVTKIELKPDGLIPVPANVTKHCAHYYIPPERLENDDCQEWQDLRSSLIKTFHQKNPNLNQDIYAYRLKLIKRAAKYAAIEPDFNKHPSKDWRIVALSQRKGRRMWLNINETLAHCNRNYFEKQIACVELDVEDLPTDFVSVASNQQLTSVNEQIVAYQSINALIGIHGSQLTQGILMPAKSVIVELFQWIPKNWGYVFWGDGWTNQRNHPTPMGIMWHNTNIHSAGWYLTRESVPLCTNVSDVKLHNYSITENNPASNTYLRDQKQGGKFNTTELEYCLAVTNGDRFRWDKRNFNVPSADFFDAFIETFYPSRAKNATFNVTVTASGFDVLSCDEWKKRGQGYGFVLYNLICTGEDGTVKPHHYYQPNI